MSNNIPIYSITLDDLETESGHFMDYISIVKDPAIMVNGFRFNNENPPQKLFLSADQQIIVAPVAIPDIHIYRYDDEMGEYYVKFSSEVIAQLAEDFNSNPKSTKVNLDHQTELQSAYILETWIIEDEQFDKANKYGFKLPVGTWMAKIKVKDSAEWEQVKDGDRSSFSLEAWLGLAIELQKQKSITDNTNKTQMEKIKFADITAQDGTKYYVEGDVAIDSPVWMIDDQLQKVPATDGEITLEDGTHIEIKEGKVWSYEEVVEDNVDTSMYESGSTETAAVEAPAPEAPKEEEAKTDEAAILAIVAPLFDEVYKAIAALKTEQETSSIEDTKDEMKAEFSSVDSLVELMKYASKK